MAEKPENSLLEISNPIIKRAFWMIGQQVPLEKAVQSLLEDRDLQSASDDELVRIIEEADRYWRDRYQDCVRKPAVIQMFAPLMIASCKQRYDRLWEMRKSAAEQETALLTARMGRLLTTRARAELAAAEYLLLNEELHQAFELFGQAEWLARATPDEGCLRVYEILWARYGQWVAATMASRQAEIDAASAGIKQLLLGAGPQAEECLRKVEALFSRHQWVFKERARLRRELRESPAHPGDPQAETMSPYGSFLDLVDRLARDVQAGRITMEKANQQTREAFPSLKLQPGMVAAAASVYANLLSTDPDRAVLLLTFTSELALKFQDQPGVQSYCLGCLGFALNRQARNTRTGFEHAIPVLERAYELASSMDDPPGNKRAAEICNEIALSNRHLANANELLAWSQRALDLWEKSPENIQELGTAYGLRGEALELKGEINAALEDHFTALRLFRQANSTLDVRKAYHHIFDANLRANRLDEAAAAGDEIIKIAQELGDLDDVQVTTFRVARALVRVNRPAPALQYLARTESLTIEALKNDSKNRKLLEYYFESLMWMARFNLAILSNDSSLSPDERGELSEAIYGRIEKARQIALELNQDARLAAAWLQLGLLQESLGKFTAAIESCSLLEFIPDCPPAFRAYGFLVEGRIRARQENLDQAKDLLDRGLETLGETDVEDIRIHHLITRGTVKEKIGDKAGAIEDYKDAVTKTLGIRNVLGEEARDVVFALAETAFNRLFRLSAEGSAWQVTKLAL